MPTPPKTQSPGRRTPISAGRVPPAVRWRPGATVGEYRLASRLAVGGTAEVWLAMGPHPGGGEAPVALKTVRPGLVRLPDELRSFIAEAAIAERLVHPNIVRLLRAGPVAGRYCMVLEYVPGLTLRGLARALRLLGKRFPPRLLVRVAQQACAALHHAHELGAGHWAGAGLVHRDVSPDNLMVVADGTVKVIDFGSARVTVNRNVTGPFMGKLRYAAPERIHGLPDERRIDVYSLGVILYEHATGLPPYQGDDLTVISRIVEGRPTPPRQLVADLPAALERIILRAMARDPRDRYPTAAALGRDLAQFLAEQPAAAAEERAMQEVLQAVFRLPGAGVPTLSAPPAAPAPPPPPPSRPTERFAPDAHVSDDEVTRRSLVVPLLDFKGPGGGVLEGAPPDEITPVVTVIAPPELLEAARKPAPAPPPVPPPSPSRPVSLDSSGLAGLFDRRPPIPEAPTGPFAGRTLDDEAARCFERGLLLVAGKKYDEALAEWQRAGELDPANRLYQTNLRRLRAQLASRGDPTKSRPQGP